MLQTKWLVFLSMLWVSGMLICGVVEQQFLGSSEASLLNTVMNFNVFSTTTVFGVIPIPVPNTEWFGAIAQMLVFDFAIFSGTWEMVRWIIFMPIAFGIGMSVAIQLIQIVRG